VKGLRVDDLVDEAEIPGPACWQRFSRENEIERGLQPDQTREAHRPAESGRDSDADVEEAELRMTGGRCEAVTAGERQLQPGTYTRAIDRRDCRDREPLQAPENPLPHP
jgi:hypothetical protein